MLKIAIALVASLTLIVSAQPALGAPEAPARGRQVLLFEDHVVVTASKPGGITSVEIYDAGDAAGAKRLARQLGSGVVSIQQAPYIECPTQFGGAQFTSNSTACAVPYSWTYNGWGHPQVYFNDHTPAQWPVYESVVVWNQTVGIDSWWTIGCPSPSTGKHCVDVWNADYGTGWQGKTNYDVDAYNHFIDGSAVVHLNDNPVWATEDYRGTTCHELGHALGLAHNRNERSSCIFRFSIPGPDGQYPLQNDRSVLTNIIYSP